MGEQGEAPFLRGFGEVVNSYPANLSWLIYDLMQNMGGEGRLQEVEKIHKNGFVLCLKVGLLISMWTVCYFLT